MRFKWLKGVGCLAMGCSLAPGEARAAGPVQWDLSAATGIQGGSGIWNTSLSNWFDGAQQVQWNNFGSNTAVFGGTPAGTVQLQSAMTAFAIQIDTAGYQIGAGTSPTLTLSSGSIIANADALFVAPLVAANGLIKSGSGIATLSASNTNGGTLSILDGAISFAAEPALGIVARPISLGGGRLIYTGANSLALASGRSVTIGASGGGLETPAGALLIGAAGQLAGTGLLTKSGDGVLRIQVANAGFTGSVRVNAGTLQLDHPAAINAASITLAGGTLSLRSDASDDFQSSVSVIGNAQMDVNLLSIAPVGNSHGLGNLSITAGANLATQGLNLNTFAVHDLALSGSLAITNTAIRISGAFSGSGAVNFAGASALAESFNAGLIFSNSATQTLASPISADAALGRAVVGVDAGAKVTYIGAWQAGGTGTTSSIVLRSGGTFVAGAAGRINTLTADRTGLRPFTVIGLGSGTNTIDLDAAFVADHTLGGSVADGIGALEVRDAVLITRASASLPMVTKLDGYGGTHRAGSLTFSGTAGATWRTTSTQTYDGGITFNSSAALQLLSPFTHSGTVGSKFDGQFQIPAGGVTVSVSGTLLLSGSQGYAPGSTLRLSAGTITFNTDPGAGFYTGHFTRDANGNVLASPAPAGTLAVTVDPVSNAVVQFAAPVSRLASLALGEAAAAYISSSTQAGERTLVTGTLSLGIDAALNLTNNRMVLEYSGASSPLTSVADSIKSGYNAAGAHWTGSGIRSSIAATDARLAIGYAEASQALKLTGNQTAQFGGATVDATTVLARLTLAGDTNLDGIVTFGDFQRFELGFGQAGNWYTGDFNYDGAVGLADFSLLYNNFGRSIDSPAPASPADQAMLAPWASAFAPEPGALTWIGLASLLTRRRRNLALK